MEKKRNARGFTYLLFAGCLPLFFTVRLTLAQEPESLETLINEAKQLFLEDKPIDARAKLQKALKLAPEDYRPYLHLGEYYLSKVAHFPLAYRYVTKAEELFEKVHGSDRTNNLDMTYWREHARILSVLSEAQLNFDRYEESQQTLERFGKIYFDTWFPGSYAWVLMKLKRLDEAIRIAQYGVLKGAEPGRTFNILGILLSMSGHREQSLDAFAKSIEAELLGPGTSQAATPLNNSGEVYRELFRDEFAESAWREALKLPDGCEHILPSLNLAMLYIDELRLFQAERVLLDFEACFKQSSIREDSEHRALVALARGRINLLKGDFDNALSELSKASNREQWFGKIGTNENDVRFSTAISLATALDAKAQAITSTYYDSTLDTIKNYLEIPFLRFRAWWLMRRAQKIGIDELHNFEDLFVRNSDTMLEYPRFGNVLKTLSPQVLEAKIQEIKQKDKRPQADGYYNLFLGINYLEHGKARDALELFSKAEDTFVDYNRLLEAEASARKSMALEKLTWLWSSNREQNKIEIKKLREKVFSISPALLRSYGMKLPVSISEKAAAGEQDTCSEITSFLFSSVLEKDGSNTARYHLELSCNDTTTITLIDRNSGSPVVSESSRKEEGEQNLEKLINTFIGKAFSHRFDPPGRSLPKLPSLEKLI